MKTGLQAVALLTLIASISMSAARAQDNPISHEGVVSAPIDKVWAALTTKAGQESWMVAHSDIDLRIGGRMRSNYDPNGMLGDAKTIEQKILSFDPLRMVSFQVTSAPATFPYPREVKDMWTVIYLEEKTPKSTMVRVVSQGFGADPKSREIRAFFEQGNAITLKGLQQRFIEGSLPGKLAE